MSTSTAFVSYSWEDESHKQWVLDFTTRLRGDGIDAKLDQWHAVPGDQLPAFMETAVRENDFVVIICTPKYKERADSRSGGVGYEGDIVTAEVFTMQNQRKFIPVLRHGDWTDASPSWMTGKYYVDLRGEPYSEVNYADLISTLLGTRPEPPPVGSAPNKTKQVSATLPSGLEQNDDDSEVLSAMAGAYRHPTANAGGDPSLSVQRGSRGEVAVSQAAAICFRRRGEKLEFLLVRTDKRRIFPKGNVKEGEALWIAAEREAKEEAGAEGQIQKKPLTSYWHRQGGEPRREWSTAAFLLEVTQRTPDHERGRDPKWYTPRKAEKAVAKNRDPEDAEELQRVIRVATKTLRGP